MDWNKRIVDVQYELISRPFIPTVLLDKVIASNRIALKRCDVSANQSVMAVYSDISMIVRY
jgi:hypothetical protein